MVVFHSRFSIRHGPPLCCLHGKNLENRKKLTTVRITNSADFNSKNIVNNVGVFNDVDYVNNKYKEILLG